MLVTFSMWQAQDKILLKNVSQICTSKEETAQTAPVNKSFQFNYSLKAPRERNAFIDEHSFLYNKPLTR